MIVEDLIESLRQILDHPNRRVVYQYIRFTFKIKIFIPPFLSRSFSQLVHQTSPLLDHLSLLVCERNTSHFFHTFPGMACRLKHLSLDQEVLVAIYCCVFCLFCILSFDKKIVHLRLSPSSTSFGFSVRGGQEFVDCTLHETQAV